jgi:hypothetical protein
VQLLDYVVTEKNADAPQVKQWGWFNTYESVPLWMVDETKSGQGYFTMGTWDANAVSSYQVGQATDATSPLSQFIHKEGHLGKELVAEELQVSLGLVVSETLAAGQSLDLYFFRTLHTTYDKAVATCKRALAQPPAYWIDRTQAAYAYFLVKGKQPKFTDPEHERLYKHSVLMMKNAQNPTVGCIVASFHPAYLYKTWMRDGMFAAMIFDAAGYHEEARAFFVWAASCHLRWGRQGFHTCYVRPFFSFIYFHIYYQFLFTNYSNDYLDNFIYLFIYLFLHYSRTGRVSRWALWIPSSTRPERSWWASTTTTAYALSLFSLQLNFTRAARLG